MNRRRFVAAGLLAAFGMGMPFWGVNAVAETVRATDAKAIQSVVQSQLKALAEGDADRAFSLATEEIQSKIGSADDFMRIIKEEYDPIYRNRRALFSTPEIIGGDTIQTVRLTDIENRVWLAIYKMQLDSNGVWKIDGCQLLKTASISV